MVFSPEQNISATVDCCRRGRYFDIPHAMNKVSYSARKSPSWGHVRNRPLYQPYVPAPPLALPTISAVFQPP